MSRRLTPFLFAGLLGVISGVYIFKPIFEDTVAKRQVRGATGTANPAERSQSRVDTDPLQQGK